MPGSARRCRSFPERNLSSQIDDFGIARIVGDPQRDFTLTRTGNALGSVSYMAPEQHEKPHEVDHRADIYSLGVVIYEMLSGELSLGRFPAPSQRTAVDARIDEIVFKTVEKERGLRQQSATEVKTDVHRALHASTGAGPRFTARRIPVIRRFLTHGQAGLRPGGGRRSFLPGTRLLMEIGMIAVLLAFVLGLMTGRERLGRFATIALGFLLVLCILIIIVSIRV